MENLKKKLLYQSMHRGCKETDLVLGEFAAQHLKDMNEHDLKIYEQILAIPDVDIYDYIVHKVDVPDHLKSNVMSLLLNFRIR